MADIETIYPEIRRMVRKCDEPTLQDAIIRATRIFCRKSWYARRQLHFQTVAPPAPTNVVAVAGDGQVTLSWDPAPNTSAYNIWYSTTSGGETSGVNGFSFSGGVISGLQNAIEYFFIVQAVNGIAASPNSVEASATPQSGLVNLIPSGTPVAELYSQSLTMPNEEVIGIRRADCNGFPMGDSMPTNMNPLYGPCRPQVWSFAPSGNVLIWPMPDNNYEVNLMAAVQPVLGSLQIPDEIAQNYTECIGYGALEWIYGMDAPWGNPSKAAAMAKLFDAGISNAKGEAMRDFQSGNLRVLPAPFIISSSWPL